MLPIILAAALRSAILIASVWIAIKAFRIRNPYTATAAWRLVLFGSLALPLLACMVRITLPAVTSPIPQIVSLDPGYFEPAGASPANAGHSPAGYSANWASIVLVLYLAGVSRALSLLLKGLIQSFILVRQASLINESWTRGFNVRMSSAVQTPAVFASTILVPPTYKDWSAAEQQAVIAHESSHVRHADFYIQTVSAINKAIYWFNPMAWLLDRRLTALAEEISDAAAIEATGDRLRYAEILLHFGSQNALPSGVLSMARLNTLRARIEQILVDTGLPAPMRGPIKPIITVGVSALLALSAAAVAQAPTDSQKGKMMTFEAIEKLREEQAKPRQEVQIDPASFDSYIGYYKLGRLIFTISRDGNSFFSQLLGQQRVQIYPESAQKFFLKVVHAQISFETDAQGHATGLVLHQNGREQPAVRITEAEAQAIEQALAKRIKDGTPAPGSEEALRRQIEALAKGELADNEMSPELAEISRPQVTKVKGDLDRLSPLESISFMGVGAQGWDMYQVKFANGVTVWRIDLLPDGKVAGLLFQTGP